MIRWKVRKSPVGTWWAHEPHCTGRGGLWCSLFNRCINCGTFRKAFLYAEVQTVIDRRTSTPYFSAFGSGVIK